MITMYKLVTQDYTTHGGMKWRIGKTNRATGIGSEMCSNQVLHCYSDPYLAVIFNPIHANIPNPRMLKISCSEIVNTDGLKHACKEQTPIEEIDLPNLSLTQKIAFAVKCAMTVYKAADFVEWAENWLSGSDRTANAANAANAAAYAAYAAANATYAAANAYAANAAYAAANATYAAANATYAAANATYAAAYAAYAAHAADAYSANQLDNFNSIIDWVLKNIE